MKKIITTALFAVAAMSSLPAMATGYLYNATNKDVHCGGGSTQPSCPTFNLTSSSNPSSSQVSASAWTDTGTGTLSSADLNYYSGSGFGVSPAGTYEGNPNHAVDNNGAYEWIMLSFDQAVSLDKITLGWISGDADMTILAAAAPSTNLSGWDYIENIYYNSGSKNYGATLDLTNEVCASYWLIGAINPMFASSNYVGNDYFKVYSVQACTNCGTPGTGVAEPGSLALAGIGLLGVIGLRRRRS